MLNEKADWLVLPDTSTFIQICTTDIFMTDTLQELLQYRLHFIVLRNKLPVIFRLKVNIFILVEFH